ncbi:MAG: glycosyltransferase family 2 protein, partial [Bacteroidota bacterium]
ETIVIDNASYDGSEKVVAEYPKAIFIQSDRNLGFAGANNLAAEKAAAETLLFLNPDTILQKDALSKMMAKLWGREENGITGPVLKNADDSIQTSCVLTFPTIMRQLLDSDIMVNASSLWEKLKKTQGEGIRVEAVSGAGLMIKTEVFKKTGGFSEYYFMYSEDVDLCFKANRLGFATTLTTDAQITHFGGGSSKKQYARDFVYVNQQHSTYLFMKSNYNHFYAVLYKTVMAFNAILRMIMLPFYFFPRYKGINAAFGKWLSIFKWAVCLKQLA